MELKNLTINFLGDSITQGAKVQDPDKTFVNRIAAQTGCICNNYGVGGTRLARIYGVSKKTITDYDFNLRAQIMDHKADMVVIFGGTNDYGNGSAPMGDISDHTPYTFYGALNCLYSYLLQFYKRNRIVVMTPIYRYRVPKNGEYLPLARYVQAIREVTAKYDLPLLDMYVNSMLHPKRVSDLKERYVPDGLHPNDDGHEIMAKEILAFLEALN